MQYLVEDFRNARIILMSRPAFAELEDTLHALAPGDVLEEYDVQSAERASRGGRPPAGGQGALNRVIDRELVTRGWSPQPALFRDRELEKW